MEPMQYPRIGVGVFACNRSGQVAMAPRLSEWGRGFLSLPGGKIDLFEYAERTALRELREETNLVIKAYDLKFIGMLDEPDPEAGQHWITLYFYGQVVNPSELRLMEPDKSGPWDWYDLPREDGDKFPDRLSVWPRIQQFILSPGGREFIERVREVFD
jgi:ADP-ribose pyrophosphatase YjhB (NUDIX family)